MLHGTKAFLPLLENETTGNIVIISSICGIIGAPGVAAYNASKFGVRGFSESLQHELHLSKSNIF